MIISEKSTIIKHLKKLKSNPNFNSEVKIENVKYMLDKDEFYAQIHFTHKKGKNMIKIKLYKNIKEFKINDIQDNGQIDSYIEYTQIGTIRMISTILDNY